MPTALRGHEVWCYVENMATPAVAMAPARSDFQIFLTTPAIHTKWRQIYPRRFAAN
jgi:hypothetical protein